MPRASRCSTACWRRAGCRTSRRCVTPGSASSSRPRRPTSPRERSTRSTAASSSPTTGSSIRSSGPRRSSASATRPCSRRRPRSGSASRPPGCGPWRSIPTRAARPPMRTASSSAAGDSPTGSCSRAGRVPRPPRASTRGASAGAPGRPRSSAARGARDLLRLREKLVAAPGRIAAAGRGAARPRELRPGVAHVQRRAPGRAPVLGPLPARRRARSTASPARR